MIDFCWQSWIAPLGYPSLWDNLPGNPKPVFHGDWEQLLE